MTQPTLTRRIRIPHADLGFRTDELRPDGIVYRIHDGSGVVISTATGRVATHHVFDHIRRLAHDPRICAPVSQLFDGSTITRLELSTNDLRRVARHLVQECPCSSSARLAVVAPTPLFFGLTRMLQAFVSEHQIVIEVFRSMEPAAAWIGCRE